MSQFFAHRCNIQSVKLRASLVYVFIAGVFILGSVTPASAVKFLWQIALEEIEGSEEPTLMTEDDSLGQSLSAEGDEVATKLDLARAYIDMGDSDGAKGILQEVLEEGNDAQKAEAEELIKSA